MHPRESKNVFVRSSLRYQCQKWSKSRQRHYFLHWFPVRFGFYSSLAASGCVTLSNASNVLISRAFSSTNWGSSTYNQVSNRFLQGELHRNVPFAFWKFRRYAISLSRLLLRICAIVSGFFGFATNTLNTWKASNCILALVSRNKFIISLRCSFSLKSIRKQFDEYIIEKHLSHTQYTSSSRQNLTDPKESRREASAIVVEWRNSQRSIIGHICQKLGHNEP